MTIDLKRVLNVGGICGALLLGYLAATERMGEIAMLGITVVATLVAFAAPVGLLVLMAAVGGVVASSQWPPIIAVADGAIYPGDALLGLAAAGVICHERARPFPRTFLLLGALTAVVVLMSTTAGAVSFVRMILPAMVLLALSTLMPDGYDVWRIVRWVPVAVLASVPLVSDLAGRWTSVAGGPNETGLIFAMGVVLAFTQRKVMWRLLLLLVSLAGLAGTAAISATIAGVAGLIVYSLAPRVRRVNLGKGSPGLVVLLIGVVVIAVPLLRPDVWATIDAHLFQIERFATVFWAGDPILGNGWANVNEAAFYNSDVSGLHNVYADFAAFTGIVGFVLFSAILIRTWRRGDLIARSVLLVWMVWVNTSGAFPGVAWAVLGFVLLAAQSDCHATRGVIREDEPEKRNVDSLGNTSRNGTNAGADAFNAPGAKT